MTSELSFQDPLRAWFQAWWDSSLSIANRYPTSRG